MTRSSGEIVKLIIDSGRYRFGITPGGISESYMCNEVETFNLTQVEMRNTLDDIDNHMLKCFNMGGRFVMTLSTCILAQQNSIECSNETMIREKKKFWNSFIEYYTDVK